MYLNTAQAGEILNAHKDTVVKMIKSGEIPARYVYMAGNEYRIHPDAFNPDSNSAPTMPFPHDDLARLITEARTRLNEIENWVHVIGGTPMASTTTY